MPRKSLVFNVTKISADLDLTPEQKRQLPPLEFMSGVYDHGKFVCLDFKDHLGRAWTLAALNWRNLKSKLFYFKSITKQVRDALFVNCPKPIAILGWQKVPQRRCATCNDPARYNPANAAEWACAKCETVGPANGDGFRDLSKVAKKATPAVSGKPKPQNPDSASPKPSMTLKERLEARRAKQG